MVTQLSKKNPLISIIMPTYNRSKILSEIGIPSILNQTYQNFELIIVSDGSTDNTEEIVKNINNNLKLKAQLFSDSGEESFKYEMTGPENDALIIGETVGKKLLDLAGDKFKN